MHKTTFEVSLKLPFGLDAKLLEQIQEYNAMVNLQFLHESDRRLSPRNLT